MSSHVGKEKGIVRAAELFAESCNQDVASQEHVEELMKTLLANMSTHVGNLLSCFKTA